MRLNKAEREREAAERAQRVIALQAHTEAARETESQRVQELFEAVSANPDPILQADIERRRATGRAPIQPAGLRPRKGVPTPRPILDEAGDHIHLICFGKGFGAKGRNVNLWELVWSGTGEPLHVGIFASEEDANRWKSAR